MGDKNVVDDKDVKRAPCVKIMKKIISGQTPDDDLRLTEAIRLKRVCCPVCMSQELANKGRVAKTNELRISCKECSKNSSAIAGINVFELRMLILDLEQKVSTLKTPIIPQDLSDGDVIENVLRGNTAHFSLIPKELIIFYFDNVSANKIGDVRKVIEKNTLIKPRDIINLDFAEANIMEIIAREDDHGLIVTEFAKLKINAVEYNPCKTESDMRVFKIRISRILKRRASSKPVLKKFLSSLLKLSSESSTSVFRLPPSRSVEDGMSFVNEKALSNED